MNAQNLAYFPNPEQANEDGLLAIGGDLSVERLYSAYYQGIFPWYDSENPILWFSPNPRMLLFPENIKISKSMRQILRKKVFHFSCDKAFEQVIRNCSEITRKEQDGTWIHAEMIDAYLALFEVGLAHSVEVWDAENNLVGGLYGVSIGRAFFGESMFSKVSNASKAALLVLNEKLTGYNFDFIDCQMHTNHLESMGAREYPRAFFLKKLEETREKTGLNKVQWQNLFANKI